VAEGGVFFPEWKKDHVEIWEDGHEHAIQKNGHGVGGGGGGEENADEQVGEEIHEDLRRGFRG